MKRPGPMYPILSALVLTVGCLVPVGCGQGDRELDFPPLQIKEPDLTQGGILKGTVRFEGPVPSRRPIRMSSDAICRSAHLHGEALDETLVVTNGRLRDVLVHITSGLEGYVFDYEKSVAVLDQIGCTYAPHVLALRTYQPLEVHNSDATVHNVNTRDSKLGQGFNRSMTARQGAIRWQFPKPELGLRAHCNIHPWMQAVLHILDHPYFSISGEDGRYSLPRKLPPGTYTVEARHPKLGVRGGKVLIKPGQDAVLDFSFSR